MDCFHQVMQPLVNRIWLEVLMISIPIVEQLLPASMEQVSTTNTLHQSNNAESAMKVLSFSSLMILKQLVSMHHLCLCTSVSHGTGNVALVEQQHINEESSIGMAIPRVPWNT